MKKLFTFLGLLYSTLSISQTVVTGTVTNSEKTPLIGVSVFVDSILQVVTDDNGKYYVSLDTFPKKITFSYVGYESFSKVIRNREKAMKELNIQLKTTTSILNTVTVTGSRVEKKFGDEAVSVEVITPDFIEKNYVTSLENLMARMPGVQVVEGQVNIRSSGFAQGAGSRVGIYVDGQPLLDATLSNIPWNFVPLENVEQIEVVKGPASILYGGASMNGMINVITKYPTEEPFTSVTLYQGVSSAPEDDYKKWWHKEYLPPSSNGAFFVHRRKINKFDLVIGGNVHQAKSHIQDVEDFLHRINVKTRYRMSDRLTFGVNASAMYYANTAYFLWMDGDANILKSAAPLQIDKYYAFTIDPHLTYFDKKDNKHTVRGRFYNSTFVDNFNDNTPAYIGGGEYQFQRRFKFDLQLTTGVSYQSVYSNNANFAQDSLGNYEEYRGWLAAPFAQVERSFLSGKLNLNGGLRWEFVSVNDGDYDANVPTAQFATTYKITPKSIFRASFGQGYRLPSLTERYADRILLESEDTPPIEGIAVIPNPNLRPEFGWSTEVGYKKIINQGNWNGYFDISAFWMEYTDLINFAFDLHKELNRDVTIADLIESPELFGFRSINVDKGRVAGVEVGALVNGKLGEVPFRLWGGYTYAYPANMDSIRNRNENYWTNFAHAFTMSDDLALPSMLTYRNLHLFRLDAEATYKDFSFGFTPTYNGFMHRIDPFFEGKDKWGELLEFFTGEEILPGVTEFREEHKDGDWVFDVRVVYDMTAQHRITFAINNFLNKEYALRFGRVDPLRTFNIRYQVKF